MSRMCSEAQLLAQYYWTRDTVMTLLEIGHERLTIEARIGYV